MHVTIAGPVDLPLLARLLEESAEALPSGLGGTVLASLVAELSRSGHEVTVVTLGPGISRPVQRRIGAVDIRMGPYRSRHRAADAFRQERRAVRDLLDGLKTDVVHAHWTYEFGLGALASRHPVLVSVHDWAPAILRHHRDHYRAVRLAMQIRCLAKARHLAVVSPYIKKALRRHGRGAALLPNGLPTRFLATEPGRSAGSVRRILSVNSGFSAWKNVTSLLRAFVHVRQHLPGAELVLVGSEFEPGGSAEAWARSADLAQAVVFAGPTPLEKIIELMDTSDLFVAPTLEESFGMTVLEAMARGVPVVGGHASGAVPWLLDFGRAGELTDVRRPERIADAVVILAGDPRRRARLRLAGLERARSFGWSSLVPWYEEQYRRVARDRHVNVLGPSARQAPAVPAVSPPASPNSNA
ncbi:glycosyltransferase family 4 protein [Streptomyces sp. CA-142005]|uniref:glycosyltransferase family 4 protein n=1 Tax=Streptomyces sp. CA-142005 TaxID=3240052 RepID=UPI003D940C92